MAAYQSPSEGNEEARVKVFSLIVLACSLCFHYYFAILFLSLLLLNKWEKSEKPEFPVNLSLLDKLDILFFIPRIYPRRIKASLFWD